jgi:hypothetical protein
MTQRCSSRPLLPAEDRLAGDLTCLPVIPALVTDGDKLPRRTTCDIRLIETRRSERSAWPTWPGAEDVGEVSLLKFVDEHLDRFDGDLPHPAPRVSPVSDEPYAGAGLRTFRDSGASRSRSVPRSVTTSRRRNLQASHYGAVRAQIKVIGRDASAVAARDADKVRVWLSRRRWSRSARRRPSSLSPTPAAR